MHFSAEVLDALGLTGMERGNVSVRCPFHRDENPSASINLEQGLFNCHGCGKAGNALSINQAFAEMNKPQIVAQPTILQHAHTNLDLTSLANAYLKDRGIVMTDNIPATITIGDDPTQPLYGYLIFRSHCMPDTSYVARNLLDNQNPKHFVSAGDKELWWLCRNHDKDHVILVEGISDALALYCLGIKNVVAALGSKPSKAALFELREKTTFVLFDSDYPGWDGATEVIKTLRDDFQATAIRLDIGLEFGYKADPASIAVSDAERLLNWLNEQRATSSNNDVAFVHNLFFAGENALLTLPTGLPTLDELLHGGYKDGLHVIAADPRVGKSTFVSYLAAKAVMEHGFRVLLCTYELPRAQCWARIAATRSKASWVELEMAPLIAETDVKTYVLTLAQRLRIVYGWTLSRVEHAMSQYDVFILDYLQRMPSDVTGSMDEMTNTARIIRRLANVVGNNGKAGKIMLVVSSVGKQSYQRAVGLGSAKYSGDIDYVCQSMLGLERVQHFGNADDAIKQLHFRLSKNTRGGEGAFLVHVDLRHAHFTEQPLNQLEPVPGVFPQGAPK